MFSKILFFFSYHKIGGDVCSGGSESLYSAIEMPCCYTNSGSSSNSPSTTTSVVLGVFVIIALVIIGVFAVILTIWMM